MSVKIKCEYCWKSFEVPDEDAGKTIKCKFCDRTILVKASTVRKETSTVSSKVIYDEKNNLKSQWYIYLVLAVVSILSLANIMITLYASRTEVRTDDVKTKNPDWEKQIEKRVDAIDGKLTKLFNQLDTVARVYTSDIEKIDPLEVVKNFTDELGKKLKQNLLPSIRLITDQGDKTAESVNKLNENLNTLESRLTKLLEGLANKAKILQEELNKLQNEVEGLKKP